MFPFPVLANGDIFDAHDVRRALDVTGADGVLIARGALGNPWIFVQAIELLDNRRHPNRPHIRRTFFLDLDTQNAILRNMAVVVSFHFVNICRGTQRAWKALRRSEAPFVRVSTLDELTALVQPFLYDETPMPLSRMPSPQPKSYSHIA